MRVLSRLLIVAALCSPGALFADQIAVRYTEGVVRGFLVLRTLDGKIVANGDLIQFAQGSRVTSRLVFRFRDGSLYDETAVFSQQRHFKLVSDHLVQKGPTFPGPLEMSIDVAAGRVTVKYTDEDGEAKIADERLDLPPDLANGMMLTLLKNVRGAPPESLSMVVATPKPRLVTLLLSSAGEETFSTGTIGRKAMHYVVKVDIGGLAGIFATLFGKDPPDSHVWILGGTAPAFVKSEGPMFAGGPVWRIELVSPVWPKPPANSASK